MGLLDSIVVTLCLILGGATGSENELEFMIFSLGRLPTRGAVDVEVLAAEAGVILDFELAAVASFSLRPEPKIWEKSECDLWLGRMRSIRTASDGKYWSSLSN